MRQSLGNDDLCFQFCSGGERNAKELRKIASGPRYRPSAISVSLSRTNLFCYNDRNGKHTSYALPESRRSGRVRRAPGRRLADSFRIDGDLLPQTKQVVTAAGAESFVKAVLGEAKYKDLREKGRSMRRLRRRTAPGFASTATTNATTSASSRASSRRRSLPLGISASRASSRNSASSRKASSSSRARPAKANQHRSRPFSSTFGEQVRQYRDARGSH